MSIRLLTAAIVVVLSCSTKDETGGKVETSSTAVGCGETPDQTGPQLPDWAQESDVPSAMPGVLSQQQNVIAYPFARPLLVDPPALGPLNKVLLDSESGVDDYRAAGRGRTDFVPCGGSVGNSFVSGLPQR